MKVEGWHELHDGRDGLYVDGICVAAVGHEPGRDPPYASEGWSPDGVRSTRHHATLADAQSHCERHVRLVA